MDSGTGIQATATTMHEPSGASVAGIPTEECQGSNKKNRNNIFDDSDDHDTTDAPCPQYPILSLLTQDDVVNVVVDVNDLWPNDCLDDDETTQRQEQLHTSNHSRLKLHRPPPGQAPLPGTMWNASIGTWMTIQVPATTNYEETDRSDPLLDCNREQQESKQSQKKRNMSVINSDKGEGEYILSKQIPRKVGNTFRRPAGPAPRGYEWDSSAGVWRKVMVGEIARTAGAHTDNNKKNATSYRVHAAFVRPKSKPARSFEGTYFVRPKGAPPLGMVWDKHQGLWVPRSSATTTADTKRSRKSPPEHNAAGGGGANADTELAGFPSQKNDDNNRIEESLEPPLKKTKLPYPRPLGRPPVGKIWDSTQGVWVKQASGAVVVDNNLMQHMPPIEVTTVGLRKRPMGRRPKGKVWNPQYGMWVDKDSSVDGGPKTSVAKPTSRVSAASSPSPTSPILEATDNGATNSSAKQQASVADGPPILDPALPDKRTSLVSAATSPSAEQTKGVHKRPTGRTPKGKVWDAHQGKWVDQGLSLDRDKSRSPERPAKGKVLDANHGLLEDQDLSANDARGSLPSSSAKTNSLHPRPMGRSPKGKVWDADHGRWIDQDLSANLASPRSPMGNTRSSRVSAATSPSVTTFRTKRTLHPRPMGRTPNGKVWDSHRGTWVDRGLSVDDAARKSWHRVTNDEPPIPADAVVERSTPRASTTASPSVTTLDTNEGVHPMPRGRPPVGKIWDTSTGRWVSATDEKQSTRPHSKSFARPQGRPPIGKTWDKYSGVWVKSPTRTTMGSSTASMDL
ncbi:hypothetical protein ACA910_022021 [Epithemia clementina (nom. ined.)]